MPENKNNTLVVIISAVIALSAGTWFGFDYIEVKQQPVAQIQGAILPNAKTIKKFTLTDNKNHLFTQQNIKNKWSLLFFGYTHCPDVCPTTLNTLQQVDRLMTQKNLTTPQIILVSIDPQRDTPEILDQYVSYFNKAFIGITGELSEIQKLADNLGVYFKKAAGASGDINADDYAMDHTSSFIVVNPDGKVAAFLTQPHNAERIVEDLGLIVASYQ